MVMCGLWRLQLWGLRIGSSGEGSVQFQTEPESARDEEQRSVLRQDVHRNWGIRNCDAGAEKVHKGEGGRRSYPNTRLRETTVRSLRVTNRIASFYCLKSSRGCPQHSVSWKVLHIILLSSLV